MLGILQNYCGGVNKNLGLMLMSGLLIVLLKGPVAMANQSADTLQVLLSEARNRPLGQATGWLNLLHYKINLWGSRQSQADDAAFFLSAQGHDDPQAELEASLRAFYATPEAGAEDKHAQCRFPARLHWLDQQLHFRQHLPRVQCAAFEQWKQQWQATDITLLFPGMYLNNPASMFGHTFIRFDMAGKSQLLSPTLSYAAAHDESDSLLVFSLKGIFGGYRGRFAMQPYYETLRDYSDIEQRDIWEYQLNLLQAETAQLVRHLWEVSGVSFDYYFFRENCAFRLLALLDVAREGINMSLNSHPFYAIPVDTVRDIERAGLIAERKYRPAKHSKISHMAQQMNDAAKNIAFQLIDGETEIDAVAENNTPIEQVKIFEFTDALLSQRQPQTAQQKNLTMRVLSARSRLPEMKESHQFNYSAEPPESSHPSARWQLATGEDEGESFYELGLRPGFHDDLDSPQGFSQGVSISALDTRLRWYKDKQKLEFDRLNVFSIRSLVSVESWATPLSRKISLQINKRWINNEKQLVSEIQPAIGYAKKIKDMMFYGLLNAELDYATQLDKNYAMYLGWESGFLWHMHTGRMGAQFSINYQSLKNISGERGGIERFNAGMQTDLTKQQALRVEYISDIRQMQRTQQTRFSYAYYF